MTTTTRQSLNERQTKRLAAFADGQPRSRAGSTLRMTDDALVTRGLLAWVDHPTSGKMLMITAAGTAALPQAPATREARTWDATTADTHQCAGACGQTLPAKSFPTTGTPGRRGVVCRKDRDAARSAA
jgi:hypothetical protein